MQERNGYTWPEPRDIYANNYPIVISDNEEDDEVGDQEGQEKKEEEDDGDGFSSLDEDLAIAMTAEVERQVRRNKMKNVSNC